MPASPLDREFEYFAPHAVKGSRSSPCSRDYRLDKTRYTAFYNTNLEESKQEQVARVEVVGVCTSICVMETVKELFDRDLPTLVSARGWPTSTPRPRSSP